MESIIVHPKDKHMAAALLAFVEALKMPFEKLNGAAGATKQAGGKKKEKVAKIQQGQKVFFAEGKGIRVTLDEIWKWNSLRRPKKNRKNSDWLANTGC